MASLINESPRREVAGITEKALHSAAGDPCHLLANKSNKNVSAQREEEKPLGRPVFSSVSRTPQSKKITAALGDINNCENV